MTFIANVLSEVDLNNSTNTTGTSYTGTGSITSGYNSVLITVESDVNSDSSGLKIQFSPNNSTWSTYYNDTYFTDTKFSKSFKIIDKYWRLTYATPSATFSIQSRLVTSDNNTNGINNVYNIENPSIYDAFGKLRVTNPYTLIDNKFPNSPTGTIDYLSNSIINCYTGSAGGTATFGNSICDIEVTGSSQTFISQTRKYAVYQPGKSMLFLATGIINNSANTSTSFDAQIGLFDDDNGLFFQYDGTDLSVNIRKNGSDTAVVQNSWNMDKLDGTGNSGYAIDNTKAQLFVIDYEWLSIGRIRYGFYLFGEIVYCHQIINYNSLTEPYMVSPNLPIRYQLTVNDANTAYLRQICSTVISEGGYNPQGRTFGISNGASPISAGNGTETPILALRGSGNAGSLTENKYSHENILPQNINILTDAASSVFYRIRLFLAPNAPDTNTGWTDVNENSVLQYTLGGSITIGSGQSIIVNEGYINESGGIVISNLENVFNNLLQLTSNINNTSDILVITAAGIGKVVNTYCAINWHEVY
jgi:hypothetical protein